MAHKRFRRWHLKGMSLAGTVRVPVDITVRAGLLTLSVSEHVTRIRLLALGQTQLDRCLGLRNLRSVLKRKGLVICREAAITPMGESILRLNLGWPFEEAFCIQLLDDGPVDAPTLVAIWTGRSPAAWTS